MRHTKTEQTSKEKHTKTNRPDLRQEIREGFVGSLPIAAGYFSVSFSFGILAAKEGLSPLLAGLISITNVTSAGQFAGLTLIAEHAGLLELILTQLVINLRYGLMSLSLSQRLFGIGTFRRLAIAFANTDEIFAVAVSRKEQPSFPYMMGLEIFPVLSWTAGTIIGAASGQLLPASVLSALGVALYGMFVAIVLPPAREQHPVRIVVLIALLLSLLFSYAPVLNGISSGFKIIICTVAASALGAALFPEKQEA